MDMRESIALFCLITSGIFALIVLVMTWPFSPVLSLIAAFMIMATMVAWIREM